MPRRKNLILRSGPRGPRLEGRTIAMPPAISPEQPTALHRPGSNVQSAAGLRASDPNSAAGRAGGAKRQGFVRFSAAVLIGGMLMALGSGAIAESARSR